MWALIIPLALSSWGLRTVIYWAMPRYAYFVTVMFIFLAAFTVTQLLDVNQARHVRDPATAHPR